jgi:hypothetical protein
VNTNGLAKLYDRLTPHERLPLIVAAAAWGDDQERQRLMGSAPKKLYEVPDYQGLADGFIWLRCASRAGAQGRRWRGHTGWRPFA